MIRVFALLGIVGLIAVVTWVLARLNMVMANARLHATTQRRAVAEAAFERELLRKGQIEEMEARLMRHLEEILAADAAGTTYLPASDREAAQKLVADYRQRHPQGDTP